VGGTDGHENAEKTKGGRKARSNHTSLDFYASRGPEAQSIGHAERTLTPNMQKARRLAPAFGETLGGMDLTCPQLLGHRFSSLTPTSRSV